LESDNFTILWHSVAPFIQSGYGRVTKNVTSRLAKHGYRVIVSAYYGIEQGGMINYDGVIVLPSRDGSFGINSAIKYASEFNASASFLCTDPWAFCFSEDTEVLTSKGWKKYDEIYEDELIATFNLETNKIEFNKLIEKVKFEKYVNNALYIKTKQLDFILSDNHDMLVTNRYINKWNKVPLGELVHKEAKTLVSGTAELKNFGLSKDFAWLLGFIMAEGSMPEDDGRRRIFIYQGVKNERIIQKVRNALYNLKFSFHEYLSDGKDIGKYKSDKCIQFQLHSEAVDPILKYFKNYKPKVLIDDLLYCSQEEFESILEGIVDGDGRVEKCNSSFQIKTAYREVADYIQTMCIFHNYRCIISDWSHGVLQLTISKKNFAYISDESITKLDSKPTLWCVRVKNGTVIIRRNGRHCIVGNSSFPYKMPNPCLYGPLDMVNYPQDIVEFIRRYWKIFPLCEFEKKLLIEQFGITPDTVIPHGVDTSIFKPMDKLAIKKKNSIENKFVFGTVNANSDREMGGGRKAWGVAMKAMRVFLDNNPDVKKDDLMWLVHSDPYDPRGFPLIVMARKFGLDGIVKFSSPELHKVGINDYQLAELYNTFDVFLGASKREGFSLTTLESIACGVPVISHKFSALEELAEDHGWLVKSVATDYNMELTPILSDTTIPDVYDLADKIKDAFFNDDKRQKFSKNCVSFARKYDWNLVFFEKWLPAIESIKDEVRQKPLKERLVL